MLMASKTLNSITLAQRPAQLPIPISSAHVGPGYKRVPGISILNHENPNRNQSDRTVKRNAVDTTNARVIARPTNPLNSRA
jgi:hypothetical protein